MDTTPTPAENPQPRDATNWAKQNTHTLRIEHAPSGALNINVDGRQITSPLQGFGQMWQKTYRISLKGAQVTPATVILTWKEHFAEFWPANSRFFGPLTGIAPGEVAILNLAVGGMPLSTGVLVLYADDESFTLMTPQGHMFAGWITFSAYEEDGVTQVQAQVLMRASDPIYELGLRFGGHKQEDVFWQHTLGQLAKHFNVEAEVTIETICVDKKLQWSQAKNIWLNSAIRTQIHRFTAPLRRSRKKTK
jgi:hypothetical protein